MIKKTFLSGALAALLISMLSFVASAQQKFQPSPQKARPMVAITASTTIGKTFCGTVVTNEGAAGSITATLGTDIPVGCVIGFVMVTAQNFVIDVPAGTRMSISNTITNADGDSVTMLAASGPGLSVNVLRTTATQWVSTGGNYLGGSTLTDTN